MDSCGSEDCRSGEPLNVVILGKRKVGKSSVGNAILGREEFRMLRHSEGCVEKQANVDGRLIKVVHTPGWTHSTRTIPYNRKEIKDIIYCCTEGLVAFLLVVSLDSEFTEKDMDLVEEHMNLISSSVWEHTVLLFITRKSDKQRNRRETDNINKRTDLNWLMEKGGDRRFMFNKEKNQVTSLRTKLLNVAKWYGGVTKFIEEKTETDNGKQQENFQQQQQATTIVHGQRTTNQESHHGEPLNVVILGKRKVGKSSVGNAILGREEFRMLRHSEGCVEKQANVDGRLIKVVHTPGWTHSTHTIPYNGKEIKDIIYCCTKGLVAFLLVVSIDSEFTEEDRDLVEEHMNLISSSVWEHTVLLFITRKSDKQRNRRETDINKRTDLNWLMEKCGDMRFMFNKEKNQVTSLLTKLANVAKWYGGVTKFIEEKTETDHGKQQENFQQQQQATTIVYGQRTTNQESHHGQQDVKEHTEEQLERLCGTLKANKSAQTQEMAKFCEILVEITTITGPINEKLKNYEHLSALFVDENRAELIERVGTPISIADSLFPKNIIEHQQYQEIQAARTSQEKMRLIYTALNSAEAKKAAFLELLVQKDRYLVQDLAKKKLGQLEASDVDMP